MPGPIWFGLVVLTLLLGALIIWWELTRKEPPRLYYGPHMPRGERVKGDTWYNDSRSVNVVRVWNGTKWVVETDPKKLSNLPNE